MASFRKRNDTWSYRIRYFDNQQGKWRESTKSGFVTKKQAQLAAAEIEKEIEYSGFNDNGQELVSNFLSKWLEVFKRPNIKSNTYELNLYLINNFINPRWGNYQIKRINRVEYAQWINELKEKENLSIGTIRRIHSVANSAFNDALLEFRIIKVNPLTKIKMPIDEKEKPLKYYSHEELEKLLTAAKPSKLSRHSLDLSHYTLFFLLAHTGLRVGEATALTWDDIDFENCKLKVNKTIVNNRNKNGLYITSPKTKSSIREIKLDQATISVLKAHRINLKKVQLAYRDYKTTNLNNLLFFSPDGDYCRPQTIRLYFKVVCKRAGIHILSPHSLRHTHAVHLLESGANIKYVSERLGHATIKTTADVYLHVTKKMEDDALEKYENYIQNQSKK
ncbi:site-specific integrase [Viridibacillus arvi]|uniref:site-specific integrase n=1 Tax=Viridibacillus arvi TaxID=263475 RepID=UPI003D2B1480